MDQRNQKSLLPDFSANGFSGQFNGIPHGNTNAIMSTIQSLQMHSMGNQLLPHGDLQTDLQNQFLIEQFQLRAMQSMYNTFNNGNQKQPQASLTMSQFNSMTGNEPSTSSNVFSASIPTTSGTQINASQPMIPTTSMHNLAVQSSMMLENKLGQNLNLKTTQLAQTTIPQAQAAVEDWMKNICVDSLLDPKQAKTPSTTPSAQVSAGTTFNSTPAVSCATPLTATVSLATKPSEPSAASSMPTSSESVDATKGDAIDFDDEAHDDVDNIFGLSLSESDVRSGSMYRRPDSADRVHSPIDFTPPDSPQAELTFDEIFGISAPSTSAKAATKEKPVPKPRSEMVFHDVPSTSKDATPQRVPKPAPTAASKEEDDFVNNFVKPQNVPVYKQKAALMSLEARENARKEDPNYDAFEFEDDDDFVFGGPSADLRREPELTKKIEQKAKSVYITGVGFSIRNDKEKEYSSKKYYSKPSATHQPNFNDTINEKAFFTTADEIRAQKDQQLVCAFLKPEQVTSTECVRNMRKVTREEPMLPKFIIRVEQVQNQHEEPMTRRRYKRKKNKSDNDDSDFEDVAYRKRKTAKKVYTMHKENDPTFRRTVLDFSIGPCVSDEEKKRVSMFGPAEGILPKGTYVICKADMLKEDCAVWRVDNQNLLQKFPPFRDSKANRLVYRSSSTYSGWCEQISSQYFRVAVKIIKQTRSETTVEPEVPLAELFPASSVEWFKNPGTVFFEEETKVEPIDDDSILTEPRRVSLNTLVNAYLTQVFTKTHVESLIDDKDWTYSRSIAELETNNKQCEGLIKKRIPVEPKHNRWIAKYTRLAISKSSFHCFTKCQICKRKKPRRVIHFFDKTSCNEKLLVENLSSDIHDENEDDEEYPIVSDAISCGRCSMAVDFLHRMHHIKFHMLRICEDKLEEIGTSDIDLTSDKIVEKAKADKVWTLGVIQKYCDLWDQVRYEFRDV
ncbi:EOR-2 [Caenorhabditis elegans]|uniref:EOR-2 n=1 Tax=Caenorhabditis elegans TaxID=6239 RepID=G5EGD8_CAEEL|nr:EOR-2 [Caenorhabditis elegans]AAM74224.1 EOR-2B [Caenorhabditis elegans]CAB01869.3 EOR-2 [Caenorhabditis elegans]|eukprot:NP_001024471.1 Uncharacterized protein CELE_C44H4.7 [Caenorhabditis elegans]